MKTMRALSKKKAEVGLWLEEVPVPQIGINDVLIKVLRTGICGTDLHIYNWDAWARKTIPVPMVVGHEFVGQIVEVVRHAGARHVVVTDVNPYRLDLARRMGATLAVDVRNQTVRDAQKQLGMKEGFDVGLEMSGNPTAFRDMLMNMAHGGKIAMLGIPEKEMAIDWNLVIFNMLTIKGIYGREMYETWYMMTVMLQRSMDTR